LTLAPRVGVGLRTAITARQVSRVKIRATCISPEAGRWSDRHPWEPARRRRRTRDACFRPDASARLPVRGAPALDKERTELGRLVQPARPVERLRCRRLASRGWRESVRRSANKPRAARTFSCAPFAPADQRNDLKAARTSVEKSSGSSHAAKWPPRSTSLK